MFLVLLLTTRIARDAAITCIFKKLYVLITMYIIRKVLPLVWCIAVLQVASRCMTTASAFGSIPVLHIFGVVTIARDAYQRH